jgi:hypothetical protein
MNTNGRGRDIDPPHDPFLPVGGFFAILVLVARSLFIPAGVCGRGKERSAASK